MTLVTEGWEVGPTEKRELKGPARIQRESLLIITLWHLYFCLFIAQEIAVAFMSFLSRLIFGQEPKSVKGRVCLVTGAGRGLGREFCLALAKEGAIIACVDINEPNNKTTAKMVKDMEVKAMAYTVNIAIKKDVDEVVSKIEKDLGPIYLLINNAAIVGNTIGFQEEVFRAAFNTNVFGSTWLMNAVLPYMKLRNEGHIVNISSIASKMMFSPLMIYGATKASLSYISNCLRAELQLGNKKNNIVITTVYPSVMNTSEDYLTCISLRMNLVLNMRVVIKATMKAIHYCHEEVIVPSMMKYPLILVTEMLPSRAGINLLKLVVEKITIPHFDQYKYLPWYDLVKGSSFMKIEDDEDNK